MRAYETAFLIAPTLPDEEIESLIQSMAEIVEKNAGKMDNQDLWGKRRLAYPIQKFGEAYYVFFHYHSEPVVPSELDRHFKQTEAVIRHMTFVLDERENVRLKKRDRAKNPVVPGRMTGRKGRGMRRGPLPRQRRKKRMFPFRRR